MNFLHIIHVINIHMRCLYGHCSKQSHHVLCILYTWRSFKRFGANVHFTLCREKNIDVNHYSLKNFATCYCASSQTKIMKSVYNDKSIKFTGWLQPPCCKPKVSLWRRLIMMEKGKNLMICFNKQRPCLINIYVAPI